MNRVVEIDALRALACLIILIAHTAEEFSKLAYAASDTTALHNLLWSIDLSRSAVTLFFAISGFVICSTIKGERKSGSISFWGRRLFRLFPVFWLSNIAALLIIYWPSNSINWLQFFANLTMIPKVFGQESLVAVYWTLETDLMFYFLTWGIFMLGFHNRAQMLLLMCVALVLLTFFFVFNRDSAPTYHYWMAMPYHISFMFWAALYRLFNDSPETQVSFGLFSVSTTVVFMLSTVIILLPALLAFGLYVVNDDIFGLRNSASYIIGMLAFITLIRWLPLRSKILAHFGNYTYAIYLFHAVFILGLTHAIKTWAPELASWPIAVWIVVIFAMSVAVAHFVFNYVEKPIMKYSQQLFRNPKLVFQQTSPI